MPGEEEGVERDDLARYPAPQPGWAVRVWVGMV